MGSIPTQMHDAVARIEQAGVLDAPSAILEPIARRLTRTDTAKRLLSGAPLGHRLHPVLTDIPIGTWTSATLLDLLGGRKSRRAARRLIGVGIVAAVPTAAPRHSDGVDMQGESRRVGVVHAASNSVGLLFQVASWSARGKGHHKRGALLSLIGLAAVGVGGYLGGHLVFARREGVDVDVPILEGAGWQVACRTAELLDGQPLGVEIDGVRVMLVRDLGRVYALAAVCSHAGGPLDEGQVRGGTIECPWHGSRFCLEDGSVARGPAVRPQYVYDARVRDELVEVRRHRPTDTAGDQSPRAPVVNIA
ncbi:MAG: Rieske 2Fe-2S domain-containing protein [Acidimicrobiia bacterium]